MASFEEKTQIVMHAQENAKAHKGAVVPPLYQNSLFVLYQPGEEGGEGYVYTRDANPTIHLAEQKLAQLEEGEQALLTSSGMAAISSAIMHFVRAGGHVVCIRSCYGGTYDFLSRYLKRFGVEVSFVDGDVEDYRAAIRPNTQLFYLESPSTAIFRIQDIRAITDLAKEHGIHTVMDNTWATPMYQNPLKMGLDLAVHSASKYLGGHSDLVAGAIVGAKEDIEAIRLDERMLLGGCMDPHAAWLLLRGMRTLPLRVERCQKNAMAVARFLEGHPRAGRVFYPGLESDPGHELAQRQMQGYTSLMSFLLPGGTEVRRKFIRSLKVFQNGCSWGGFESLVIDFGSETPGRREEHGWYDDAIRLYVGLEDEAVLIEDLRQALEAL